MLSDLCPRERVPLCWLLTRCFGGRCALKLHVPPLTSLSPRTYGGPRSALGQKHSKPATDNADAAASSTTPARPEAASASASNSAPAAADSVAELSVKQLKKLLGGAGVSITGVVEKSDLRNLVIANVAPELIDGISEAGATLSSSLGGGLSALGSIASFGSRK